MATDKPRISVTLENDETLQRIEKFRFDNRISTLSKAASMLIQMALEDLEPLEVSDEPFDAIEKMDQLMKDLAEMKENMMKHRKGD